MSTAPYIPTPSEIRRLCLEIQERWTPTEERSRRGVRGV